MAPNLTATKQKKPFLACCSTFTTCAMTMKEEYDVATATGSDAEGEGSTEFLRERTSARPVHR